MKVTHWNITPSEHSWQFFKNYFKFSSLKEEHLSKLIVSSSLNDMPVFRFIKPDN